jgi:uncharacterized damage-inducible protein DinB
MTEALLAELEQEAATTQLFLEAVPADKLGWKPHDRSMSLGQLALHVASLPGGICDLAALEGMDAAQVDFSPPAPETAAELLVALTASVEKAKAYLLELQDDDMMQPWTLFHNGEELMTMPRMALLRALLFNHWYHHRGQLSVYLRLLDVPVPVAYGRTADVDPFA